MTAGSRWAVTAVTSVPAETVASVTGDARLQTIIEGRYDGRLQAGADRRRRRAADERNCQTMTGAYGGHQAGGYGRSSAGPGQGWICRLPGARENITVCGVAPVPASTHRVS